MKKLTLILIALFFTVSFLFADEIENWGELQNTCRVKYLESMETKDHERYSKLKTEMQIIGNKCKDAYIKSFIKMNKNYNEMLPSSQEAYLNELKSGSEISCQLCFQ